MLSTLIHAAGAILAIMFAVALVRTAFAVPTWWLLALFTIVMAIPVSVLSWAGLPPWIAALPMAALFAVQIHALGALAIAQWRRLQELRRGRGDAASPAAADGTAADPMLAPEPAAATGSGWWDAPTAAPAAPVDDAVVEPTPVDSLPAQADTSTTNRRDIEEDDLVFEDLIRRNFTAH